MASKTFTQNLKLYKDYIIQNKNKHHKKILNYILIIFVLIVIPKQIFSGYIEIEVNNIGRNQILSDDYRGNFPNYVYVNGESKSLSGRYIYVDSKDYKIRLEWNSLLVNFGYMFSNLQSITNVYMYYIFGKNSTMNYMFYNCINLKSFSYTTFYSRSYSIINMQSMFSGCISLKTFYFSDLYLNYYDSYYNSYQEKYVYYNIYINISEMFYNCEKLESISYDNYYWHYLYVDNMKYMFYNCISLKTINLERFKTRENYFIDLSYMFYNCYNLESITFSTSENSFGVNNMNNMFYNCKSLKKIDFRSFNASTYSNNYIDMSYLCNNCEKLTEVKGLFNNLYITSAHNMFYNCISLKEINIETFDRSTSGYIDFSYMFYNCYNLETITFTYLKQVFRVKYMNNMFNNCTSLKEINLWNFYGDTDYTIDMKNLFYNCISLSKFVGINTIYISNGIKMFYNCKSLKTIELQNLKTISDTFIDLSDMFYNCHNLISIYFPSSNGVIGVRKMTGMFFNCTLLKKVNLNSFSSSSNYYLDLSNLFSGCISLEEDLKISKAFYVYDIRGMFSDCISLKSINLGKFKTRENTFISLSKLFYNCKSLETISFSSDDPDFGVKDMDNMFYGCNALKEIDFSSWKGSSDHYINMSRLFYNSKSLTTVGGDFNNLYISDAREMFYGCVSLKSLSFGPNMVTNGINLKKMFYNCEKIESIRFYINSISNDSDISLYFHPSEMTAIFYNCKSLKSITFNHFENSRVHNMSYMLYNCFALETFIIQKSYFYNSLITDMKEFFTNCKSLITLDLTNFYTTNVEIMWGMFKGCTNLQNLITPNFDTSKVTDMESMFEGCSNLISLNLSHFNTSNVQYMNKMFKDCSRLESLYFSTISTDSLATMQKMFYNCRNLKYLNFFSLIETGQSIFEMFEGASDNFKFCIQDKENIPNIFDFLIKTKNNTERDCTDICYGLDNERIPVSSKKLCCPKYEYKGNCYDECPRRTEIKNTKNKCEDINCGSYYFNYEQKNCTSNIPEGYYMNDTNLRTIDKCHKSCKTCIGNPTNCLTCSNSAPYYYLGNCYDSCKYDYYEENGILKCKCFEEKCFECSEESLNYELCIKCNEDKGYYPKYNDTTNQNNFVNCYKVPERYYFNFTETKYKPCYHSCKYCIGDGNKLNHFCTSCNSNNNYPIPMEDNENYTNCYPNCTYNFYFDDEHNYKCLDKPGCPSHAPLQIENSKQCVKTCKGTKYKYEFRNTCFASCPAYSVEYYGSNGNWYCKVKCPFHLPFEKVKEKICVSNCTIMERYNKLCITNYTEDRFDEIQDMIMSDIKYDIVDTFDYKIITNERSIIYEERNIIYEITYTHNNSTDPKMAKINLGECETRLKKYYGIEEEEPLYILKIDAFVEGKIGPKVEYEIYYSFNKINLHQLDISICEGIDISIGYNVGLLEKDIEFYDKNSPYYNDICYIYTNPNGSDITLEDRQQEFKDLNLSLCEEDCHISSYDRKTERVECSCEIKLNIPFVSQIKIDKNKLYKFMNLKYIANFNIMICYKLLLSVKGIVKNIGFYCSLPTIVAYFICQIMFYKKDFKLIKALINKIIFAKKNLKYLEGKRIKIKVKPKKDRTSVFQSFMSKKGINLEANIKNINTKNKINIINIKKENRKIIRDKKIKNLNELLNKNKDIIAEDLYDENDEEENKEKENDDESIKNDKEINAPPKKITKELINVVKSNMPEKSGSKSGSKNLILKKRDLKQGFMIKEKFTEKQKQKIVDIMQYNDTELNELEYKKAVQFDKRRYCQYYISLLKVKHLILKIFNKTDYNSFYIKIYLVFFNFLSSFAINALFFIDDTMHKIYLDGGKFNFIYQLPQIIYSTIISFILNAINEFLGLSQNDILNLKREEKIADLSLKGKKTIEKLKVKFLFFFFLNFILIMTFCYYLGCFCAVYQNTQFHLIKDTLISFGISNITPLGINLLPGLFRIPAISKKGSGKICLFVLSKLLQKL